MKKYSNMAEFAAELNLARSTVSYILNDKWQERNISPKTVKRVKDYAKKVNFVPNFFGRAIKGKIYSDAAILLPNNAYRHHREAFFRLMSYLNDCKLKYIIIPVASNTEATPILEQLLAYNIQKVVMIASPLIRNINDAIMWQESINATPNLKWLLYDCPDENISSPLLSCPNVGYIGFNRQVAMQTVLEYVKQRGYDKLYYYGFSVETFQNTIIETIPLLTTKAELLAKKEEPPEEIIALAIEKIYSKNNPTQAIFINDDLLTIKVITKLQKMGFEIPKDLAFISWDGLAVSDYFHQRLTTLEIPNEKMLSYALDFISDKIKLPKVRLVPQIRIGDSMPPIKK